MSITQQQQYGWACVFGHRIATSENVAPRCKCGAPMRSYFYPPAGLEGVDRPKGSCTHCGRVPEVGEDRRTTGEGCICSACLDELGPVMGTDDGTKEKR